MDDPATFSEGSAGREPALSPAERLFRQLHSEISSLEALLLAGVDGRITGFHATDPHFDGETFAAEYGMLLRIAERTSEDAGMGDLSEHILISSKGTVAARRFSADHYAIALCTGSEQLGRLRYLLRLAASARTEDAP